MLPRELPRVDIVVRCRNKMPYVERTLERLLQQRRCIPQITFLDCDSTDGSRECAARFGVRVVPVEPAIATAGAMMNHALRITRSLIVVFVDADATPLSDTSVAALVESFEASPTIAIAFGRQTPRREMRRTTTGEWQATSGAPHRPPTGGGVPPSSGGSGSIRPPQRPPTGGSAAPSSGVSGPVGGSFSIAAAAVHRSAWHCHPFDARVRAGEDLEWIQRLRRDGWTTECVHDAPFEECHDQTLRGHFLRTAVRSWTKQRALTMT